MTDENNKTTLIQKYREILLEKLKSGSIIIESGNELSWADKILGKKSYLISTDPSTDITPQRESLLSDMLVFHKYLETAAREYRIPANHDATLVASQVAAVLIYSRTFCEELVVEADTSIDSFFNNLTRELKALEAMGDIQRINIYMRVIENGATTERPFSEIVLSKKQAICLDTVIEEARQDRVVHGIHTQNQVGFEGAQKLMDFITSDQTASRHH